MSLYLQCLILHVFLFCQQSTGSENCLKSGTSTVCCADYFVKNGQCVPCPDGSFGPNCIHPCPYPTYGRRCLTGTCDCPQEACDPTTGCIDLSNKQTASDISSYTTTNIPKSKGESTTGNKNTSLFRLESINNFKHLEENKNGSSAVIAVISVIGVLIISLLVAVIVFQLRGKINLRQQKSSMRGSNVTSQRHVDTYCEIDDNQAAEGGCNTWSESEIYEQIDQSNKEGTKYTALPPRPGTSKQDRAIMSTLSMQKILEADDDEDTCTKVQMRRDKNNIQAPPRRADIASAQASGYIDMNKEKELEDYVQMATEKPVSDDTGSLSKD